MSKALYFSVGKNIQVSSFERNSAPIGWLRKDLLMKRLKEDRGYRAKFSRQELNLIKGLK